MVFLFLRKVMQKFVLEKFNMKDYNSICTPIDWGVMLSKYYYECKVDATYFKSLVGVFAT